MGTLTHDWRRLGIAHPADLARVDLDRPTAVLMMPADGSDAPRHGYWDALWARSQAGRLTLVAQAVDYDGGDLRGVYASPPSLTVDLPVATPARVARAVPGGAPSPNTYCLIQMVGPPPTSHPT